MKKLFLLLFCLCFIIQTWADDFVVNGIRYVTTSDNTVGVRDPNGTAQTGHSEYSGNVNIPANVVYNGVNYAVTSIADYAFHKSSVSTVSLPEGMEKIGKYAFKQCTNLHSIKLPESLRTMDAYAFWGSGLYSIVIPKNVTSIGSTCFEGARLSSVWFEEGGTEELVMKSNVFRSTNIKTVMFPERLKTIPGQCFYTSSIQQIILPFSTTKIESSIYSNSSPTDLFCLAVTPPSTDGSFTDYNGGAYNSNQGLTLHVPSASLSVYKSTSPWKNFSSIVSTSVYTVTYQVEGEASVYKQFSYPSGAKLPELEQEPYRGGCTFSGWSGYPADGIMPNRDVVISGKFTISDQVAFSGTGSGSVSDPFLIYNIQQLDQLRNFQKIQGVVFKLMKDLDISSYLSENYGSEGWEPVGVEDSPFEGVFDGNGHAIRGFYSKRASISSVGFFGFLDGATIRNLTLSGTTVAGASNVGVLAGSAVGCDITHVTVSMSGTSGVSGSTYVGGLIGNMEKSNVSLCSYTGSIKSTGNYVGGLVGSATSDNNITGVQMSGNVKGASFVGGLVGSYSGYLDDLVLAGDISGSDYTGGVAGYLSGEISNTQRTGSVTGNTFVGGLAGQSGKLSISDCNVVGDVSGSHEIGGLVGQTLGAGSYSNISQFGNISGEENVSGGIGEMSEGSSVSFSYIHSRGMIINIGDYTGGVVGKSSGGCIVSMEDCSHFGEIKGKNYVGGLIGALVNSVQMPIIHTWIQNSNMYEPINPAQTWYDTISKGNSTESIIANCMAGGNIEGSDFIGGLVGYCEIATGYTSSQTSVGRATIPYSGGTYTPFVWCDDKRVGRGRFEITEYVEQSFIYSLKNSYYCGSILGNDFIGGIAGSYVGKEISACYTSGSILGSNKVGGILGFVGGRDAVSNVPSYSISITSNVIASVSVTANANIGRIYGQANENVSIGVLGSREGNRAYVNCRLILNGVTQAVESNLQNGSSVGLAALKNKANYVSWGWDFDDNWNILETESFPYKKYQAAPPYVTKALVSQDTKISGKSVEGGSVYMTYKNHDTESFLCVGNDFEFDTEPLQSGSQVQIFTDVDGKVPSYINTLSVKFPGSGTEDDPYLIYSAGDLHYASGAEYLKIMQDIDLTPWISANSPLVGWVPIGGNSDNGTYIDGNNHTVSGLWVNTAADYVGLFSYFTKGSIKNLTVKVADGKSVKGNDYTGLLIGKIEDGSIENCRVEGRVEGSNYSGGMIGLAQNTQILSSISDVQLCSDGLYVGGLIAQADNCEISKCIAEGSVLSTNKDASCVGGLVGSTINNGSISQCRTDISVNSEGSGQCGGLVGHNESAIAESFSAGIVTSSGDYTGGLVGMGGDITNSYSSASVNGNLYSAGLIGYSYGKIDKSYSSGDVNGVRFGAGLVGQLDGTSASVKNSIAANQILNLTSQYAWGSRVIGGYKNGASEPILGSNYALETMQVSLNNIPEEKTDDNVEGVSKSEVDLVSAATYAALGWDMSRVWSISEGAGYPTLKWLTEANPVTEIALDQTSLSLIAGKNAQLIATIRPSSATNKQVTWTSSNTEVATVADGLVTAVAEGKATITATSAENPEISASCEVTVSASLESAIAVLRTLVSEAQSLYDNSTEGESAGQYEAGSRAALLAVITTVNGKISDDMTQAAIAECTTQINDAVTAFRSHVVSAGEDTDISAYRNVIFIPNVESCAGSTLTLSVRLNNADEVNGYQFGLYLPDGATVATETNRFGKVVIKAEQTNERTDAEYHTFKTSFVDDYLQVLCYSGDNSTFFGNEGEVARITINLSADMEAGEYPIIVKDEAISLSGKTDRIKYIKSTLRISDYKVGDANGDTYVDVGDISAIAGHILGTEDPNFVEKAADANEDTFVDVGDISTIAGWILDGSAVNRAPARNNSLPDVSFSTSTCYMAPGNVSIIPICVSNTTNAFSSFQLDVELPEGLILEDVLVNEDRLQNSDYFNYAMVDKNNVRLLDYSLDRSFVSGNEGAIAYLVLRADENMTEEMYSLKLTNGVFACGSAVLRTDNQKLDIVVSQANGIESFDKDVETMVYDLNGRYIGKNIEKISTGMSVVNGRTIYKR